MRRAIGAAAWVLMAATGLGTANAAPMPVAVIGTWSNAPGCPANALRMILTDNEMTVFEHPWTRHVLGVDTSGTAAARLELRITRLPPEEQDDPQGPHIGDVVVLKLENGRLHLLGVIEQGKLSEPPQPISMERCG
jgi:hypothetical protein